MSDIVIVDTSILVNVLRVPMMSDQQDDVLDALEGHVTRRDILMLPAATVLETGNHIAQNGDGNQRRDCGVRLREMVEQSVEGVPWQLAPLPENPGAFAQMLRDFPERATAKIGFADLTIINLWQDACRRFPARRVAIWSLDRHLQGYDRQATEFGA